MVIKKSSTECARKYPECVVEERLESGGSLFIHEVNTSAYSPYCKILQEGARRRRSYADKQKNAVKSPARSPARSSAMSPTRSSARSPSRKERYQNAKKGLTEKHGGMNLPEFRKALFEEHADANILKMNRKELNNKGKQLKRNTKPAAEKERKLKSQLKDVKPYRTKRKTISPRKNPWDDVPVSKVKDLSPEQVKYCRCVAKVTIKNQTKPSGKAVNPYAVCHASVKGSGGRFKCPPKEKILLTS